MDPVRGSFLEMVSASDEHSDDEEGWAWEWEEKGASGGEQAPLALAAWRPALMLLTPPRPVID
jgi:hypothetical protein